MSRAGAMHLFETLFNSHHRALVAYLTRMTRCPQRAEDLAQAAWLKLLDASARGVCTDLCGAELRAYLFTVARNAFVDECTRKHEAVRTSSVDPAVIDGLFAHAASEHGPAESAEREQVSALVRAAVSALPAEQRRVIRMWTHGTSIKDMAAACTAPADTVLSRKKYAFARMRSRLSDPALALR